jgi:hypothetical protein
VNPSGPGPILLIDAHVHVYPQADVARLLGAAARHFRDAANRLAAPAWHGVLFLTEVAGTNWFETVAASPQGRVFGTWRVTGTTEDPLSLEARDDADRLQIIAGRQIVTKERIEVHALGTRHMIPDGLELAVTLRAVREAGALPVLPWGVGKWLGSRGRLLASTVASGSADLYLSDNGGRPWLWRNPLLMRTHKAGRPVLRGSDPLPLPGEEFRVGEFGCWLSGAPVLGITAGLIMEHIVNSTAQTLHAYGAAESLPRFLRNQVLLRLKRQA